MISTLIRFVIASVVLGLVYAGLAAMSQLPDQVVEGIVTIVQFAHGLDAVLPVHEAIEVLLFEIGITALFLPVIIFLRLWKRFSPNA